MERLPCLRAGLFLAYSWVALAVCTSVVPTAPVRAEDAAEPAGYREFVEQALREYAAGNQEESRSLFSRAHALFPNARTHRGIGMAEFELRNYQASIVQLEAALSSPVRPLDDKLRADSEALLLRARNFVGSVLLDTRPQASALRVDGLPVELTPGRPLVLRVGDHSLEVVATGYAPEKRQLVVQGGETLTLTILFTHVSSPASELSTTRHWYKNPWLWTAVGTVVVGAAVGTGVALAGDDSHYGPVDGGSTGRVGSAP